MTKVNKHIGTDFKEDLLQDLRESDEMVLLHIKEALEESDLRERKDYQYLIDAIGDVAKARGKGDLAEKAGISRQGLHKILNGSSVPSIQNIMAILRSIGLKFSVEKATHVIAEEPANVLDVAQYASKLLPRGSTYMSLQKIVYYAQAESLVHFKKPLFNGKIEAWMNGPVVRELYNVHRGLRVIGEKVIGNVENLTAEQKACINWAIEKYGMLDGDILSRLTHSERPWLEARNGLSQDVRSDREISLKSIQDYYANLPNYAQLDDEAESTNSH